MDKFEKSIIYSWFIIVSILSIGIVFLANLEPSAIILNVFIAPMSIIFYFVCRFFYDEITEVDKGEQK
ncbi:unnamed protein product [marine sediment metagenome]|uniref:Uncharacterized protein n=1 Tax=marine sediment metagenome TaxID=412755 RepID=X1AF60_9ZZZZ